MLLAINSLEKVIVNSNSNNNLNNIENSIRAFGEYVGKLPWFIKIEEKNLTDTVTLQNNVNDMIITQDNIITEPINVICNEQGLLIQHTFSNVGQILLLWNTNKVKIENKKYLIKYSPYEKQRLYRIKKVIKVFLQQSLKTNVVDTTEQFENYFRENNKSMYSLAQN